MACLLGEDLALCGLQLWGLCDSVGLRESAGWNQQIDDDTKKETCGADFDASDDKKKSLEHALSGSLVMVLPRTGALGWGDTVTESSG